MNLKAIKSINEDYLNVAFIILINILIFGFLPNPNRSLIAGDDYIPELNPKTFFQNGYYIWSGEYGGVYYYPSLLKWVFNFWFYAGYIIGIPTGYVELFIYYIYSVAGGVGIYIFFRKIFNISPISSLLGAFFYLLNPYTVYFFKESFYAQLYTIAFLPWILYFTYLWLKNNDLKYFFLAQVLLLVSSPIAVNLPAYVSLTIFILIYIVFYAFLFKYNKLNLIKKILLFIVVLFLFNLWWIIFVPHQITTSGREFFDTSVINWASIESNFINLFRFLGAWDLTGKFGPSYNPWAHVYEIFPLNILLFVPSMLAIVYLLIMKHDIKRSKNVKIVLVLNLIIALLLLFLIKRYNPPFAEFTVELYSIVPFLWSFRTADVKLMPIVIFIFSIFLALSVDTLSQLRISNIIKKSSFIMVVIVLLFYSVPFYSGEAIRSEGLYYKNLSHVVTIPDDLKNFSDYYYLHIDGRYNTLILPPDSWYKVWYTWGVDGVDVYHSILPFADIYYVVPYNETWSYGEYSVKPESTMKYVSDKFYWNILREQDLRFEVFYTLGIKYIIYRADLHNDQPEWDLKLEKIDYKKVLSKFNTTQRNFGNITLYELNYNISKFFILKDTNKGSEDDFANVISYLKQNPTFYTVKVNVKKPFTLAFAQTYDSLWVAKVNGKTYDSFPLWSVINGFNIDETGNLEITIEYTPQKWFYYGASVSIATFIIFISYLFYCWRLKK